MTKAFAGYFFEDFFVGQALEHSVPLTLSAGDVSLYRALTGSRFALYSSEPFAKANGFKALPLDPLLVFHTVFGKSVPDISLNAVANLGYAQGLFLHPVYIGDTLNARSEIIGVKENSSGMTGTVYLRTRGFNQDGVEVLSYVRWVMVNKRDRAAPAPVPLIPDLPGSVQASALKPQAGYSAWDDAISGSPHRFEDYAIGEKINHIDGMTVEEAEHQLATRLYQNTARVHFDGFAQKSSRFGRRLIYGGVVISLARALSFNGLGAAGEILAINAGTHVGPLFAGDTLYAWSEILDKAELSQHVGALRLRLVAVKDQDPGAFPLRVKDGAYGPGVCLDFDYWAAIPRR